MKTLLMCTAALSAVLAMGSAAQAQTTQDEAARVDDIIVTGVRASLAAGLDVKRNSTQIVESIVAEDIGKLPDNNVVEALQRVTGVQVTNRSGGEADGISIRGLPDITTTMNGRNIFTASGRQFALQDIPANLVRRIDVYKTRAADQIETGIAGQVDVFTRHPFDFDDQQLSVFLRGSYQEQGEYFDPNVSILVSDRWDTGMGEVGALLNVSYVQTRFRDQSVTAGAMVPFATADNPPPGFTPLQRIFDQFPPGLDRGLPSDPGSTLSFGGTQYPYLLARDAVFASDLNGDRRRPAVNAALQWAPNDTSEYTFEFFYDGFRNEMFNSLHFTFADWWGNLRPNPGQDIELFEGTNIIRSRAFVGAPYGFQSGDFTKDQTDSFVYALNGKWRIGDRFDLTADLSYQDSEFETQFLAVRTDRVSPGLAVNFNDGDGMPAWQFIDAAGNDQNDLLVAPSSWTVAQFYDNGGRREGDAVTLSVDGDYDATPDGGILSRISFGFRYDDRGASESQRPPRNDVFLGQNMTTFDEGFQYRTTDFFDGRADVPTSWLVPNGYYVADNIDMILARYGLPSSDTFVLNEVFNVKEVTTAAYFMADLEPQIFDRPLFVQAGVRWVNVDTDMDFIDIRSGVRSDAAQSVDELLPSVTLRYDLTDSLRLRFNYGQTLRRPNFIDLNPNFNLTGDLTNVGYGNGSGGNPDLEATRAENLDFAVEWYFAPDSILFATAFNRKIDGLVVPLTRRINVPNSGLNTNSFVVTQPVNASDGELKGVEIGFIYFPDYLPDVLQGLGVQGSVTKLDSSQNIPQTNPTGDIIGQEETSFFGVSDLSYNVTLAYERGPIGARLSYVWRDDFLNNNEARLFANPIGIWRQPEQSLDFQLNYDVNDRFAVSFDAVNLTDELQQSYYAFADAGGPDTHNFGTTLIGRTFSIGLRYSLF